MSGTARRHALRGPHRAGGPSSSPQSAVVGLGAGDGQEGGDAAVDGDGDAVDVGGVVADEKGRDAGNILAATQPPGGDLGEVVLVATGQRLEPLSEGRGVHGTGGDDVRPDAVAAELGGDVAGQS